MKIIERIEIKNFRSFGNRKKESFGLTKVQDLNILSGANDSGKSNILRALNLFFNKHTNLNEFFDFDKDFFKKETLDDNDIKEELITIKIHFLNIKNAGKNQSEPKKIFLPEKFWVSRKFKRNTEYSAFKQDSSVLTDFQREKKDKYVSSKTTTPSLQKQLTDFISSIQYHYIPAIKDKEYFSHLYGELQQTLWKAKTSSVIKTQKSFQDAIQTTTESLMDEFSDAVETDGDFAPLFELPHDLVNLFKTLSVNTGKVDLTLRGDGVQAKLIPEILYFIAKQEQQLTSTKIKSGQKAKKYFIWGFEEPENSYEYKNADKLAHRFKDTFTSAAQIFLTTHAFNFLSVSGENVSTYRVWKDINIESSRITKIIKKSGTYTCDNSNHSDQFDSLQEELGVFQLNEKLDVLFQDVMAKRKTLEEKQKKLDKKMKNISIPIVISEGRNKRYIEVAKQFFCPNMEFEILDQPELGDTEIEKLFNFLLKTQDKAPKKLFVVDCDSSRSYEKMTKKQTDYLQPFIFETNLENTLVKKGIENLFNEDLFEAKFYSTKEEVDDYGAEKKIQKFNKSSFEKYICEELKSIEVFKNMKPLFEKIEEYFSDEIRRDE